MQRAFLKLAFTGILSASSAFASSDLLSKATDGAVVTAKAEATILSSDEMKDVRGAGWRAPIYRAAFSTFTTTTRFMSPTQRLSAFTRVN